MRLTTRLLLAILPIVLIVMTALGAWFLFERERVLVPEVQQQTRAYARALDIAFEHGLRELDSTRVRALLDRTTATSRVSGVRVFDLDKRVQYQSSSMVSAPLLPDSMLARVLQGEAELAIERIVDGEEVFSVLRSIREPAPPTAADDSLQGAVLGAVEVMQPYDMLLAQVRQLELDLATATLILVATVALATAYMAKRQIAAPLEQLVAAARALGEGQADARVPQSLGAAEPNALAREFNLMAQRLQSARQELLQEGAARVRLERRLAEAEKLATVGTLAAGLAHEIGAPLNVISGRAEMLLGTGRSEPDVARHLHSIVAQSGRIARTVRSLLDYARRPARRDDVVSFLAILDATIELLEPDLERSGVAIDRRHAGEVWMRGDADQLQQVLTNLLLNALQAMDGQPGPHTIAIETHPAPGPSEARESDVVITVTDTGPGLSADLDGRLFTPFSTTKPTGTGLGLVVARSIVQDHGGTLDGTTRTDGIRGARFTLRLPIATDALGPASGVDTPV